MELREYQAKFITDIRESLFTHTRIIATAPTGSGKGVILGAIAEMAARKGSRLIVVSHRIEVVRQNLKQIMRFGIDAGIVSSEVRNVPNSAINVAMAQTLRSRRNTPEFAAFLQNADLLVIDEAHDCNMNFLFEAISARCYVIGLTATPVRYGNQRQLGLDYSDIVQGPQVGALIDLGYLCRCRLFGLDAPKMDDVEWSNERGDYVLSQMAAKFRPKTRYVGVVDNWERLVRGTKTIVFCCSSEQTIGICREFNERGYDARYVLSGSFDEDEEMSGERKSVMDAFARGDFDILVNMNIGTTGLDVPDIKTVVLDFATTSLTKYLQCLGRASRPHSSKDGEFNCLDFGDNWERLGRYEDNRQWYLWHKKSRGGPAPLKECKEDEGGCGRLIPIQWEVCQFCGHVFLSKERIYEIELQEIVAQHAAGEKETNEQYVARKKLEGWGNNRILASICKKNPGKEHAVFLEVIPLLRTNSGEEISPKYWYSFKKFVLKKKKG